MTETTIEPEATEETAEDSTFDQVLVETERRKSIREQAAEKVGCKPHALFDLLRNQWRVKGEPLSDLELFQAISLIARYDLDPLVREIHCSRDKHGRILVVVGIDGWIKILHRTEGYDGHEQSVQFAEDGVTPLSVTTTIYSKLRSHPVTYVAYWKEYAAIGGFMKESIPLHMLRLFSLRHAARQFAPVGGNVVTEAEERFMQSPVKDKPSFMSAFQQRVQSHDTADGLDDLLKSLESIEPPLSEDQFNECAMYVERRRKELAE